MLRTRNEVPPGEVFFFCYDARQYSKAAGVFWDVRCHLQTPSVVQMYIAESGEFTEQFRQHQMIGTMLWNNGIQNATVLVYMSCLGSILHSTHQ
jgi:hypothetical protein